MSPGFLPTRNADRPGDDPIFALNREASERRAAGERVINATVGALLDDEGALAILPAVTEALHAVPPRREAGYAPIAGPPEFLRAVIDDLLGGTPLATQAVAVATPGGSGALRLAVETFLERGQSAVTPSFYWGPYATICEQAERSLATFPMFDPAGGFDVDALISALDAAAASQGRVLFILNDPCNNPTGYSLSTAEWSRVAAALAKTAERVPLTVLLDTAYLAFARDPRGFLAHVAPLADRALVLFAWSASKSFAQYGARVGALIACTSDARARDAIARALAYGCRGTWSNCNAGGMLAIARCLTDPALRARVDAERETLRTLLADRIAAFNRAAQGTSLRYPRYDGGFFVTVFAPDARASAAQLKARGVFVVPQSGALRVAVCSVPEAQVPELVDALIEATRA